MHKWVAVLAFFLLLGGQALYLSADIYSWTDESGVKHYSNEPPAEVEDAKQEAEHKADKAQERTSDQTRKRRQDEVLGKVPAGSSKYVTKNPGEVVFYSKAKCSECDQARRFFDEFSIPYTEYDVEKDEAAKARVEQYNGRLPIIIVGGRTYKFFDTKIFYNLFGIKGSGARIRISPAQ